VVVYLLCAGYVLYNNVNVCILYKLIGENMNKLPVKWKADKVRALELMVMQPSMTQKDIAEEVGVTRATIYAWLKDPEFVEVFYEKYMVTFGAKLPSVLQSMIREAESGNVQAGRLVLEHSGKLIKRVEVKQHQSPFEKFLSNNGEVEDAEFEVFPQRPEVPEKPAVETKAMKKKKEKKKKVASEKRREAWTWRKRAINAGVELLPVGRKTKSEQEDWHIKIIEAEKAMSSF